MSDLASVQRGCQRAYELGRIRDALLAGIPLVLIAAVGFWIGPRPAFDGAVATALAVTGLVFLWRGQLAARMVATGVGAGLVPLLLTYMANGISLGGGHAGCSPYCMHACFVGGIVAGLMVARVAGREASRPTAWALGGALAAMTGSLGCGCIGFTGVLALVGALFATGLPALVVWARQKA
jgi:hypothetical protein